MPPSAAAAPSPLFRPEAVAAASADAPAPLSLPPRTDRALAVLVGAVALGLAALSQVPLARHVRVPGLLSPPSGTLTLAAPVAGVLLQRAVADGDAAPAGTVLAWLGQDRSATWGEAASASDGWSRRRQVLEDRARALRQEHLAQQDLIEQETRGHQARQAALAREALALEDEARWVAQRRGLVAASSHRWQALALEGLATQERSQAAAASLSELGEREAQLRRQAAVLGREARAVAEALAAAPARRAATAARQARESAALADETADWDARRAQALRASTAVRVLQWLQPEGTAVAAGTALAVLVPPRPDEPAWEAQLFAPSRALGFVQAGQPVRLRLAAYPAARWGLQTGTVTAVSAAPLGPSELPAHQAGALAAAAQSAEPLYRIHVRLHDPAPRVHGEALRLRAGMALEADLTHERRPLWSWVLAPWQRWRQRLDPGTAG